MFVRAFFGSLLLLAASSASAQSLSLLDGRVVEGDTGASAMLFEARLSAPATGRVSFTFGVSDGTAVSGADYTDISLVGVLSIPVGGTSLMISVPVKSDAIVEPSEFFNATLSGVQGATLVDGQAKGLIIDDDDKMLLSGAFDPAATGSTGAVTALSTSLSQDGRYVAFASNASDLVANGPTNGFSNIYVRDTRTGITRLASIASNGGFANNSSIKTQLSADGRYLVFESAASNLVANDTNGVSDVFRRDLVLGTTVLVSTAIGGSAANSSSHSPVVSADGRHVAFHSFASNLIAGDTNGQLDVFVRDMQTGVTQLVSGKQAGAHPALASAETPSISADGRYIAFRGDSLIPEDTSQYPDIYRRDMVLGVTVRVSVASDGGNPSSPSRSPVISADGRYVVFQSMSSNLGAGPLPTALNMSQLYRRDIQTGTTILVSYDATGTQALDQIVSDPSISADGRYVAYRTYAKATLEDTNTLADIFVRDLQSNITTMVGKTWSGGISDEGSVGMGTLSADGRFIAFESSSPKMLPGDSNGQSDLFLVERVLDSSLPVLSVPDAWFQEADVDKQVNITVSLSAPAAQAVSFDLVSADGAAQADSDYSALNLTGLSIAAGQTSLNVALNMIGDNDFELDEGFSVYVSNVQNARVVDPQSLQTIGNDDDGAIVPTLSVADVAIAEGDVGTQAMIFTVGLSEPATNPVIFDIATSNLTALAGSDFVALSLAGQTIPAGETSKQFDVIINGDTAPEIDESFKITVSNVGGAVVTDGVATGTITNDDGGQTLSINDVSIAEGHSGTKLATFTISLSSAQAGPVTFDIATTDGTAVAGSDYVAKNTVGASISAGATSTSFAVTINGDTAGEADETFTVTLSNPLGAGITDGQATGTITNDDTPALSVGDVTINEGHSGTKTATFTVQLSDIAAWPVTFDIATANGTATAGSDYVALALGGQTIPAGQTSKTVAVVINGDTVFESHENFFVNVSNVVGAVVADGSATGTISNDDPSANPVLSIADARVLEGNSGTAQLAFRVSLSAPATGNVGFKLTTSDNTAHAPSDYASLAGFIGSIPAGQTSVTVNVETKGDSTIEVNETLFVSIDGLVGAVVPGDLEAVGQILNDDGNMLASVPADPLDLIANDTSADSAITPDGRYVAFSSRAADLSHPVNPARYDVYLRDTVLGTTTLVSKGVNGGRGAWESSSPSISDDGRYVVFVSYASDLVPNDINGKCDVFRRDMLTGVTELVTSPANGVGGANDDTFEALISGDGNHVVFLTQATNLLAVDPSVGGSNLLIRDMRSGAIRFGALPYDPSKDGGSATGISGISRDGRYISFSSHHGNFVVDDGACAFYTLADGSEWPCQRAYWRDTVAGVTQIVNTDSNGVVAYLSLSFAVSISADGRWVGFSSDAFDPYHTMDVFVRDTRDGKTYIASIGPGGQLGNAPSYGGRVSPDGTHVAYHSSASNLVANDTNGVTDAFVRPIAGTSNVRVGTAVDGGQANGATVPLAVSNGARYIALQSNAANLVLGDINGVGDIIVAGNPGVAGHDADLASLVSSIGALDPLFSPETTSYTMSVTASSMRFVPISNQSGSTITVNGVAVASGSASNAIALSFGVNIVTVVVKAADGTTKTTTIAVTRETASVPVLSIGDASISEGDSGANSLSFTVSLSAPAGNDVVFSLSTASGSATAGIDFESLQLVNQVLTAGATSKTFTVLVKGDTMLEPDDTFFVDLGAVSGAAVGDARSVGTIINDDEGDGPVIGISDAFLQEGHFGNFFEMVFKVSLSKPSAVPVTFDIVTIDGTALMRSFSLFGDYDGKSAFGVTIPVGSTEAEFKVTVVGDPDFEGNEYFKVNISNVTGARLGDGQGIGTIIDDDAGPYTFSIGDVSVTEGNDSSKLILLTASLATPTDVPVTFDVIHQNRTAQAGSDFAPVALTNLLIPAGATSTTFSVEILGDTLAEGDETFEVWVQNIAGTIASDSQATVTILEDDAPRLPVLTISSLQIREGNNGHPLATFVVKLSEPSTTPVTFGFATTDGTATSPSDYTAKSVTGLVIPPGSTAKQVTVSINGDNDVEPEYEWFNVAVTDVVGATIGTAAAMATIVNDDGGDSNLALSVGDVSIAEGDSGTKTLSFSVDLGAVRASSTFFDITTTNGSATAGSDYVAKALLHQEIPAGTTHKDFDVTINGDLVKEPNETILVTLSNSQGMYIADAEAIGTILDEEGGGSDVTPELSVGDVSVSEGNAGSRIAYLTVSLSAASISPVKFDLDFGNLTATAGSDYAPLSLTGVTIPPGETSKTFAVTIYGDTATEANETFVAIVTDVTGASVADDAGIVMIVNDDGIAIPSLTIADVSLSEGPVGTSRMDFTVSLSSPATSSIEFDIAAFEGVARMSYDYQPFGLVGQTIEAGESSKTFSVNILGDDVPEADEFFTVRVSNVAGAVVVDDSAIGTILNDDGATLPVMNIGDVSIVEGNAGTKFMRFAVTLSFPTVSGAGFHIMSSDGTANAGSDYAGFKFIYQTFEPGQSTMFYDVPIAGDTTFEWDETFTVTLPEPFIWGASPGKTIAVGTIINDDIDTDIMPALSIGDVSIAEGNSGTKIATFTVNLSNAAATAVTYNIATSNGTATAGSDYVASSLSGQSISAGQTSKTFSVTINGDTASEGDETFNVTVSNVTGATMVDGSAVGTITNDDTATGPTLSVEDAVVEEGNSGTKTLTFNVLLSAASSAAVTVDVATADGTATAGSDYVAKSLSSLRFAPGTTSKAFVVTINGDTALESDETFLVNLANVRGAAIADAQAIGTIVNDDAVTAPAMSIGDVSIAEGNSGAKTATFTVSLSAAAAGAVTYDITTGNGTATAGSDYVASSLTGQSIAAGQISKTFSVTINGDTTVEPDETFTVTVSNVAGATIADGSALGTISNDDSSGSPALSIGDVSISEGNAGTKTATFTVSLSAAASGVVTYDIATSNGTATAGSDYVASILSGQSIAAGRTSQTFSVTINGDTAVESDETFNVTVSNVAGATIADGSAVGTITNDDASASPTLSIGDVSIAEGNSGSKLATFTLTLSAPASGAVTYNIATAAGTATAPSDFVNKSMTGQSIAAGQTSKTFTVSIKGDTVTEPDETFFVNVTNVAGATLADGQAVGTITNDDGVTTPTLSIGDVSLAEGNSGTKTATFTVTLSAAAAGAVTYDIATSNGTATAGSDYVASSLTGQSITAGQTSKTFSVTINGDTTVESDETFTVTVSNVAGATIADGSAVGTISNDDSSGSPTLSIGDVSLAEGNSGTKTATFTVSLSGAAAGAVTYDIATSNGTATAGSDYVASSLTGQSIAAGQTSKTFVVTINGDTTVESDETFNVTVSNVAGATIADGSAIGTIANDDTSGGGPTLSINDVTLAEGNALSTQFTFTISLSAAASSAVTFNIATADGTALAGSDYTAKSLNAQSIAAGQTSKTFIVLVKGDRTVEPNETFLVNVTNVAGATLADGQGLGTITNDDAGLVSIARVATGGLVDDIDDGNRQAVLGKDEYALLLIETAQQLCRRTGAATLVAVEDVENRAVLADLADVANASCANQPRYTAIMADNDHHGFLVETQDSADARGLQVLESPEVLMEARATAVTVLSSGHATPIIVVLASPPVGTPQQRLEQTRTLARSVSNLQGAPLVLLGANAVDDFLELRPRIPRTSEVGAPGASPEERIQVNLSLLEQYANANVELVPQPANDSPAPVLRLRN